MWREKSVGNVLVLGVPVHCDEPVAGVEKWLLGLWQGSKKRTWSFWRGEATISLEFQVSSGRLHYQIYLASPPLADLTLALLSAHFPGIEAWPPEDGLAPLAPGAGSIVTFGLRSPGWVELPKDGAPESVAGLLAALGGIPPDESAIVQLLLEPTWMTTEDGRQPAFWLAGRIASLASRPPVARQRTHVIASAFGQFAGFNGLRFSRPRNLTNADMSAMARRRWPRQLLPPGLPATAAQVATLYHPPTDAARLGHLLVGAALKTPAPEQANGVPLGEGRDRSGRSVQVRLRPADLLRHALVVGPSGSGKTNFLAQLARGLVLDGHGVTVIDPHGGLARAVARNLPASRLAESYLFRLWDSEYPVSINPLKARPGQEFFAADELVEVIQRVQGREYWGPMLDLLLRHAALAAMQLGGSLVEAARLLDDPWFRGYALTRLENDETARFLSHLGDVYDRRSLPAVNRMQRLLATPWLRNILAQNGPGLDFAEIFEERSVALFDLSGIGATNARLLGSLLLLLIRQAAFGRGFHGERGPRHFVLVDEASWFVSRTVAELLDQARKFGVGIVLAVQRLGQLTPDEVREAVLANAANLLAFRISDAEEARALSRRLASDLLGAPQLQRLPRYEAYIQITRDGERLEPAWLRTLALPPDQPRAAKTEAELAAAARRRYARPRSLVEAELRQRDRLEIDNEEPEVRSPTFAPGALPAHSS